MMKPFALAGALSTALTLTACIAGGGTETEGENGAALHKAAHGTDSTKKAAARANAAGTQWKIAHEGLHGAVFIRARVSRPDSAVPAMCSWSAYVQHEASAATLPATVTVTLKPKKVCL